MNSRDSEPIFSIHEFKKWMDQNARNQFNLDKRTCIGVEVEPKLPLRRMVSKMEREEGDLIDVAREFKENGGVIIESDENYFMIEVKNGSFLVPRSYVRRKD